MADENSPPGTVRRRPNDNALVLGPRKKAYVLEPSWLLSGSVARINTSLYSCLSDPLVSHGRHFGRTVHALCNITTLLINGLLRMGELAEQPEESFTLEYVSSFEAISSLSLWYLEAKARAPRISSPSSNGSWP